LTAIVRRAGVGEEFRAHVAELPEVQARGDTVTRTLENLKQSIVTFLMANRQRAFRDIGDDAVTEIVVLEASAELTVSPRRITVTDLLRIPVPVTVQFGTADDGRIRDLFDASVTVIFDTQRLSDVLHRLTAAQTPGSVNTPAL
jgi:hypothetical protein